MAEAINADTVDHKHAVGAGATAKNRAGKLVATNGKGRLPNSIIAKAPDANRLDGRDSRHYALATLAPEKLLRGIYSAWGGGAGSYLADTVHFSTPLPADAGAEFVHFVPGAGPFTTECPGLNRAKAGHLCVYESASGFGNRNFEGIFSPATAGLGLDRTGFSIYFSATAGAAWSYGTWAVRAPAAAGAAAAQRASTTTTIP